MLEKHERARAQAKAKKEVSVRALRVLGRVPVPRSRRRSSEASERGGSQTVSSLYERALATMKTFTEGWMAEEKRLN